MIEVLKNLVLGWVVGGVFWLFKLFPPSPPTFAWIMWIVGVWLGWFIITKIM